MYKCSICKEEGHNRSGHETRLGEAKARTEKPIRDILERVFGKWNARNFTIHLDLNQVNIVLPDYQPASFEQLEELSRLLGTRSINMTPDGTYGSDDYSADHWINITCEVVDLNKLLTL